MEKNNVTATLEDKKAQKQRRKVAQRAAKKAQATVEMAYKPLEEWDEEELAKGRPRNINGNFQGSGPKWLSRAINEEAMRRFQELMRSDLNTLTPKSMKTIEWILETDETDRRGRLVVPPSVKLQAATWVVEHLLGKPTQRIEADISVKLQGILAQCLVLPGDQAQAELRPAIDVENWEQVESDED